MRFGFHFLDFTLPGSPQSLAGHLSRTAKAADAAGASWLSVMDHFFQMEQFQTAHDKSYDGWLRAAGFNRRLLDLQESTAADDIAVLTAPVLWDNGVDFRVVDARGQPMSREQTLRYLADRQARDNGS